MAYVPPYVDAAGLHINTYQDILALFANSVQSANGSIVYLAPQVSDYQLISSEALAAFDAEQAAQLAYNQRSILTAIGSGLDALGSNINVPRKAAAFSTAQVTVTGTPNTTIQAGVAQDNSGVLWSLTPNITIPNAGSISVTATCQTLGAVQALPNTIDIIGTPTRGWNSVTNAASAVVGVPVERDSQYRGRLMLSAAINSRTLLAGTQARIVALPNVTRALCIDNKTNVTDSVTGTPAHSVSCVVEGGDSYQIASTIAGNNNYALPNGSTPSTSGSTSVVFTDPYTSQQTTIGFYRPTYVQPYVTVNISALIGYTSQVPLMIAQNIVTYLNSLRIGQIITYGEIWAVIYQAPSTSPVFTVRSVNLGTSANPSGTADLPLQFYQVAQGLAANIVVTTS